MINLLLIGSGKWGSNYISTLSNFNNVKLTIANRNNWENLIDQKPDGVIIATPPDSHIAIALHSLSNNIPTMIEKPVTLSSQELKNIIPYNDLILVNYIHLFSEAHQWIKHNVDFSKITKIVSHGFNKGPIRSYSSLWDYGPHDLSIILDLLQEFPHIIDIQKIHNTHDLFNIEMIFKHCMTNSMVGNDGHTATRDLIIEFNGMTIRYDDKNRPLNHASPLNNAVSAFIKLIQGHIDSRAGLQLSKQITKILELCDQKLKLGD